VPDAYAFMQDTKKYAFFEHIIGRQVLDMGVGYKMHAFLYAKQYIGNIFYLLPKQDYQIYISGVLFVFNRRPDKEYIGNITLQVPF
jgi:hypothetical protein